MGERFTYKTREVETTEWEDVLLNHDIINERQDIIEQNRIKSEISKTQFVDKPSRLEKTTNKANNNKEITQKEEELLEESENDNILNKLRLLRLQKLKEKKKLDIYGEVKFIYREEFIKEVSEASKIVIDFSSESIVVADNNEIEEVETEIEGRKGQFVIVQLFDENILKSRKLSLIINNLSFKYQSIKFVKIKGTECIENYPIKNIPTIFIYFGGKLRDTIVFGNGDIDKNKSDFNRDIDDLTELTVTQLINRKYQILRSESDDEKEGEREEKRKITGIGKKVNISVDSSFIRLRKDDEDEEDESDDDW